MAELALAGPLRAGPASRARCTWGSGSQLWKRAWPRLPREPQPRPTLRRWLPESWARQRAALAPGFEPRCRRECVRQCVSPPFALSGPRVSADVPPTGVPRRCWPPPPTSDGAAGRNTRGHVHRSLGYTVLSGRISPSSGLRRGRMQRRSSNSSSKGPRLWSPEQRVQG